jgi:hypothetical protein
VTIQITPAARSLGSRFDRPRAQPYGSMRRQHANANLLDEVPDAGEVIFFGHSWATGKAAARFPVCHSGRAKRREPESRPGIALP